MKSPVEIAQEPGQQSWWMFQDKFYVEDDGLSADKVKALALQRERRKERQIERAQASLELSEEPVLRREPIPLEVQRAVWERDGGRCVQCGSTFNMQYDHIIPFSRGGAATVENLQILCGKCNRAKGANIR